MSLLKSVVKLSFCIFILTGVAAVSLGFLITRDISQSDAVLGPGEVWIDDWYTVIEIDLRTYAIGEPRYWQRNYNYLILGTERAVLFDTGPGVRNIQRVVDGLTELPLTVVSSHPHYDHIGNNHLFSHVAWLEDSSILSDVKSGVFQPSYVRAFTLRTIPAFKINEWWKNEQVIDLGNRALKVFHVPGHESGSIALLDSENKQLFTGDFIYPGSLVGLAATSNVEDYLSSIRYLIANTSGEEVLYGAHSTPKHPSPMLPHSALADLAWVIECINGGECLPTTDVPFRVYSVNENMELLLPPE